MIYAFTGAKGGVGTTVTSLLFAQHLLKKTSDVLLVDLTGDLGVVLGTAPNLPGVAEWTSSDFTYRTLRELTALTVDVAPDVGLLPRGAGDIDISELAAMWHLLAGKKPSRQIVVDAGRAPAAHALLDSPKIRRVLVMDCCHQALTRAREILALRRNDIADDLLIVTDDRRPLGIDDMTSTLARHATATVAADESIARWADAGLMLDRSPKDGLCHFDDLG